MNHLQKLLILLAIIIASFLCYKSYLDDKKDLSNNVSHSPNNKNNDIIAAIQTMSVLELSELVKALEETFGTKTDVAIEVEVPKKNSEMKSKYDHNKSIESKNDEMIHKFDYIITATQAMSVLELCELIKAIEEAFISSTTSKADIAIEVEVPKKIAK